MLQALSIRDFIIVDSLDLEFERGFTTLTGETGAGKSILIDALSLSLGARNEGAVVRAGCEKAEIITTFWVAKNVSVHQWLLDQGMEPAEELLMRRVIYADGRSRAYINGVACTIGQLKSLGEYLIDIYSQNMHHSLLSSHVQRQILDSYAGTEELASQVEAHYRDWSKLNKEAEALAKNAAAYADELAELRDQVREIIALGFSVDEWESLQADHLRLSNGATLMSSAETSVQLLTDAEPSILSLLVQVQHHLSEMEGFDPTLKEAAEEVNGAMIQLEDAARFIRRYLQQADLDEGLFHEIEARMQAIHAMSRKYRIKPEELVEVLSEKQQRIQTLSSFIDDGQLAKRVDEALARYKQLANELTTKRLEAAKGLAEKITACMQTLSLAGGQFAVKLSPVEMSANGMEQVEFLVAGHAGVEPRPLSKVASGGELSRISLALHVTVAANDVVSCMIFDEVDVGIGGGVAEIVGRLLQKLGVGRQVLVITHLPQVAAQAQHHMQVSKSEVSGATISHIRMLDKNGRINEIARMLGGVEVTERTRALAAEMLSASQLS